MPIPEGGRGTWLARGDASTRAEADDDADDAGAIVAASSGGVSSNGEVALFVFAGGSTQDFVSTAGCAALAAAQFWAQDAAGDYLEYRVAAVGNENAAWLTAFSTGLPAPSAAFGRCR